MRSQLSPNMLIPSAGLISMGKLLLVFAFVTSLTLTGCGGSKDPSAPADDELQEFVDNNSDIADGSGTIGE
ncbi:MAG: hypothetical protein AAF802_06355 [Planctomycetota bacterium]